MLHRLRQRSQDEGGFTLIELLVVILIIGILAAIAIPSFLNQKSKAYDASAKELARTVQTVSETFATDHNGEFYNGTENMTPKQIHEYESTVPYTAAEANGGAYLATITVAASKKEYTLEVIANNTKDKFFITRKENGEVSRECKVGVAGAKTCAGGESSSW
jgi:type IV pilus assembly protein PilA